MKISLCGIKVRKGLTAGLPSDVEPCSLQTYTENQKYKNIRMLTIYIYTNMVVAVANILPVELPASDD